MCVWIITHKLLHRYTYYDYRPPPVVAAACSRITCITYGDYRRRRNPANGSGGGGGGGGGGGISRHIAASHTSTKMERPPRLGMR
jgi:hypothetical protein